MRIVKRVLWLFCGLLLANPLSAQVFLRVEPGTWVVGGIADLVDSERSLTLMPEACIQQTTLVEVGVGFVIDEEFATLDVAGTVRASQIFGIGIAFRNPETGKCELYRFVEGVDSSFLLKDMPVDSAIYRNSRTSVVELCLQIHSTCGPPPTDEDAVSVQDVTIGPKGGGL